MFSSCNKNECELLLILQEPTVKRLGTRNSVAKEKVIASAQAQPPLIGPGIQETFIEEVELELAVKGTRISSDGGGGV